MSAFLRHFPTCRFQINTFNPTLFVSESLCSYQLTLNWNFLFNVGETASTRLIPTGLSFAFRATGMNIVSRSSWGEKAKLFDVVKSAWENQVARVRSWFEFCCVKSCFSPLCNIWYSIYLQRRQLLWANRERWESRTTTANRHTLYTLPLDTHLHINQILYMYITGSQSLRAQSPNR